MGLFAVHDNPFPSEQDVKPLVPEGGTALRDLSEPLAQRGVRGLP
jgi:hypothetical protein